MAAKQKFIMTPEQKGQVGEDFVTAGLKKLPSAYHTIRNLILRVDSSTGRTTQIDHVVASPYGIFVVETKNYSGTIIAAKDNGTWFQMLGTILHPFQSPVEQNDYHIQALARHLPVPCAAFQSVVVFIGLPNLLSPKPIDEVVTSIAPGVPGLIRHIRKFTARTLDDREVGLAVQVLQRLKSDGPSLADHLASLQQRSRRIGSASQRSTAGTVAEFSLKWTLPRSGWTN